MPPVRRIAAANQRDTVAATTTPDENLQLEAAAREREIQAVAATQAEAQENRPKSVFFFIAIDFVTK